MDIGTCERCLDCRDCIYYQECELPNHEDCDSLEESDESSNTDI